MLTFSMMPEEESSNASSPQSSPRVNPVNSPDSNVDWKDICLLDQGEETKEHDDTLSKADKTSKDKTWSLFKIVITLLEGVSVLAFWTLLIASLVQHLYHQYYEPIIERAGRAANNRSLKRDFTYYYRSCSAVDFSVTKKTASDLLLNNSTSGPEAADHMMRHGVSIIPDVLSPSTQRALRAYIVQRNTLLSTKEAIWVRPNKNRQAFALDPVEDESVVQALKEIGNHKILKPMLEGLVGPDPAITELATLTVHPRAETQSWHNDVISKGSAIQFGRTHLHTYSMFVALQDTTRKMGPTRVCPGTHYCCNNQARTCDRISVTPSDATESGVWPAGYGTLFSQQTWHRGAAHVDKDAPSRVMVVISFTSRPKLGYDNRQLARGIFCFAKWYIWGHTWQDLLEPRTHMSRLSRTLRALSIWKPSHRNWGLDYFTKTAMDLTIGQNGASVVDLRETLGNIGIPSFLNGPVGDKKTGASAVYLQATVENTWTWFVKVNVALVVVATSLKLATKRQASRQGGVRWSLIVLGYALPCVLLAWQISRLEEMEWGKSVMNGMAFREPFPEFRDDVTFVPDPSHPTTMPEHYDVLLGSRFDATFLGAYDRWLDYHPGNQRYLKAVRDSSLYFESYKGLPPVFRSQITTTVSDTFKPGRMLLQNWRTGDWKVLPPQEKTDQINYDLKLSSNPLLQVLDDKIRKQLAYYRFSAWHRSTRMAHGCQVYLTDLKKQLLMDSDPNQGRDREMDASKPVPLSPEHMRITQGALLSFKKQSENIVVRRSVASYPTRWTNSGHNVDEPVGFQRGDLIVADPDDVDEWYKGRITKVHRAGTLNIEFNDGTRFTEVAASLVQRAVPIVEGLSVMIELKDQKKSPKRATVTRVWPDGRIDAIYKTKGKSKSASKIAKEKYVPAEYYD